MYIYCIPSAYVRPGGRRGGAGEGGQGGRGAGGGGQEA